MTKQEQLNEIIECFANGNKSKFGRLLGVSPAAVTNWLSRDTFDAALISKCLPEINPDWLLTGRGEMLKAQSPSTSAAYSPATTGMGNVVTVTHNGAEGAAQLKERVRALEDIIKEKDARLEEKERLIQVLLKAQK